MQNTRVQTASDIIKELGGPNAVAAGIGAPLGTVSAWSTRDSIPSDYWSSLVKFAAVRGKDEISYELLAGLAAQRRANRDSPQPAGADA